MPNELGKRLQQLANQLHAKRHQVFALQQIGRRGAGLLLDGVHRHADFLGRAGGVFRQLADFIGHHGKAAPLLAGAGGFNRRVQGQQIGLLGNLADHADHAVNFVGFTGQLGHLLRRRMDSADGAAVLWDMIEPCNDFKPSNTN